MKKYKKRIIAGFIVAIVLALAFFYGGNSTSSTRNTPDPKENITTEKTKEPTINELLSGSSATSSSVEDVIIPSDATPTQEAAAGSNGEAQTESTDKEPVLAKASKSETNIKTETSDKEAKTESAESEKSVQADEEEINDDNSIERETIPINLTEKATTPQKNTKTDTGDSNADKYKSTRNLQGMETDGEAEKDKFLASSVPKGKPLPIEPGDVVISDKELTCILSVRCDTILNNVELLHKEKLEFVPRDGVVFAEKNVTFYEGESVFNVLLREMKRNKIHMEFENVPVYNSAYVKGIANLYEFDCGELSGWMYRVNGWTPNYGCSRYRLKDGDRVEWIYTCDLGKDIKTL